MRCDNKKLNPLIGRTGVFNTYGQRSLNVFVDNSVKYYLAVSAAPYDFVVAK